jgi:hypothetical protein
VETGWLLQEIGRIVWRVVSGRTWIAENWKKIIFNAPELGGICRTHTAPEKLPLFVDQALLVAA